MVGLPLAALVMRRLVNARVPGCGLAECAPHHLDLHSFTSGFEQRSCQQFPLNMCYFSMHLFILLLKISRRMSKAFLS